MSWASHNPELYSEIVNRGIARKLCNQSKWDTFTQEDAEVFLSELENGNQIERRVWDVLTSWASKEISASEADYFSRQVESAMNAMERKRDLGLV